MDMNDELIKLLIMRLKAEPIYGEENDQMTRHKIIYYEISRFKLRDAINNVTLEEQTANSELEAIEHEISKCKISINRLNMDIQKQSMLTKELISTKNKIVETKKEYKDELKNNRDIKIRMVSTIDTQFEEIQRIMAEKEDRCQFITRQVKIINKTYQKTTLFKKSDKEKEDEYFKSLCKTILIKDILSIDNKFPFVERLTKTRELLLTRFCCSIKV